MPVSPLGKYSQIVAAIVAILLIAAAIAAHTFVSTQDTTLIDAGFYMALGAIFGSFATINGIKPEIDAAHQRLDNLGAPPANNKNGNGTP